MANKHQGNDDLDIMSNLNPANPDVQAMLAELLSLRLSDARLEKKRKDEEEIAFRAFQERSRNDSAIKQKAELLKQSRCTHRHDVDEKMGMIDIIHTPSLVIATCASCGKQWEGTPADLQKALGRDYPRASSRIGGYVSAQ